MSNGEIVERIQRRLKELGISARKASLDAGRGPDLIRNMIRSIKSGQDYNPRADTIHLLAEILKTTPQWLLTGFYVHKIPTQFWDKVSELEKITAASKKVVPAAYGGRVETGSFKDLAYEESLKGDPIFVVQDDEYPSVPMLYFDVVGDGMNALQPRPILHGDVVVCLDLEGIPFFSYGSRDGMILVVDRYTHGSSLRERSLRQLELFDNRRVFCPRSSNKAFEPVEHQGGSQERVEPIAVVRYSLNRFSRTV